MFPHSLRTDSPTGHAVTTTFPTVPSPKHILIVEDNPADVRLIQEALRGIDPLPDISVASTGDEAVQFLARSHQFARATRPSLIFLDFHLPKTDPGDLLRFVRQSEDLQDVPVVVLTTSNADDLIRRAYSLGANSYLVKPSDLDAFFHTIKSAAAYWLNFPEK